jgi:hypothetical protein
MIKRALPLTQAIQSAPLTPAVMSHDTTDAAGIVEQLLSCLGRFRNPIHTENNMPIAKRFCGQADREAHFFCVWVVRGRVRSACYAVGYDSAGGSKS